jgi:hypothetical protein
MAKNAIFRWIVSSLVCLPVWILFYDNKFDSIPATFIAAFLVGIGVGLVVQHGIIYFKGGDWPWPRR